VTGRYATVTPSHEPASDALEPSRESTAASDDSPPTLPPLSEPASLVGAEGDELASAQARVLDGIAMRRHDIARDRARRFLVAQGTIVASIFALLLGAFAFGAMPDGGTLRGSLLMCTFVLALTGAGFVVHRRTLVGTGLVTVMLYADSIVGMVGFYLLGEFETPNIAAVALLVVMAPLFGVKKHAYGVATLLTVLYVGLLGAREWDLLPYGYVFPREAFEATAGQYSTFVMDSVLGFVMLVYGAALLAGEASLGLLTSRRALEEEVEAATAELALANKELQRRNSALDGFNSTLSHDISSPLQSALLRAELLLTEPPGLDVEQRKTLIELRGSIERMGALTRELYNLSTMTRDLSAMRAVDLRPVVSAVKRDLHGRLLATGASIEVLGPLPTVHGNAALVSEALQNLVENALKYGGAPPVVRIGGSVTGDGRVAVYIDDNGPGIPERERNRVFRPFVQLGEVPADGSGGSGAGLAIVDRIVSLHDGAIRIEDAPDLGGARFVLELRAGAGRKPAPGDVRELS